MNAARAARELRPMSLKNFVFALVVLSAAGSVFAQGTCSSPSAECVVVGEWDFSIGVGLGKRSNPIAGSKDIPLVVLPQVSYYGKRFFLDNLEVGYTLFEGNSHTLNLIATPGYDRVFFLRDDPQNYFVGGVGSMLSTPNFLELERASLRPRRTTYLAGPEWLFAAGPFAGQLSALYEATGRHKGYEVRGALAAPLLTSDHSLVVTGGFTWKSAELVDYYYGMDRYYEGKATFNPFVKLGYAHALGERLSLTAFVHYEYLGDGIADSPIVRDDAVTSAFVGLIFKVF
jgi:outer membrane protein